MCWPAMLRVCDGDYASAFARYQDRMMPFLKAKQESALKFASSFVPKTAVGIAFRNVMTRLMGLPFIAEFLIGRELRDDVVLPDYGY
jgi:2-polyprenyl-6-methoxyphenol hydroxylase-like FAD-dependent oxidoreductase